MRTHAAQLAGDLLWNCWQTGQTLANGLPEQLRPVTREDGYAIQALLEQRSAAPLFGWKIAATSRAGQAHIRVDQPMGGRILAERVVAEGAEVPFGSNSMRVAEAEFAFRMGRTLEPRDTLYSLPEVMSAVETLHPAIEIPDSRFLDFVGAGAAQLIADNACAHYFVLGSAAPAGWRVLDLAAHVVNARTATLERTGSGAAVLGDPRAALAWLANELSGLGIKLAAGQVVTTGTCTSPLPIAPGDEVVNDMGILGRVAARFSRD
jgi:2-keto-4-pentenoate hydratase